MPARRAASPAASENTRLLGSDTSFNSSREDLEDVTAKHQRTPLPKKQLGGQSAFSSLCPNVDLLIPFTSIPVLFSIRFSEPVLYSHLYPYINQFVRDIGVAGNDSRNVGFYSVMIVSMLYSPSPLHADGIVRRVSSPLERCALSSCCPGFRVRSQLLRGTANSYSLKSHSR